MRLSMRRALSHPSLALGALLTLLLFAAALLSFVWTPASTDVNMQAEKVCIKQFSLHACISAW